MKIRRIIALILFAVILSPCVFAEEIEEAAVFEDITKSDIYAAVYEADIRSLRSAIDCGLITSRELTEIYLERIDKFGGAKKCFITLCDNALEEADKRDKAIADGTAEGTLFGIPVVVKDNIEYAGYPTTNGRKKDGSVSESNAAVVQYLLDEGAVILGKANMSTDAQEARITNSRAVGETTNAYDSGMAAGGSSGGTAVSVSLNLAAAGLGTDTNSSLRYPAVLNGCVSLRPTFDLVPRDGVILLNGKRDVTGAITRTVYDQAVMLDAITGGIYSFTERLDSSSLKGARLGVIKELSYPYGSAERSSANFDSEISAAFEKALSELKECGAEIVEVSLPRIFSMSSACSESYSNSAAAKDKFYEAYKALFESENLTAVVFPSYVTAPLYTGVTPDGALKVYQQTSATNFAVIAPQLGIPEMAVQIGLHSRNSGMGIEFAGLRGDDQKILDLAYSYTLKYDHRTVPEYAENLYGTAKYTMSEIVSRYIEFTTPQTSDTSTSSVSDDTGKKQNTGNAAVSESGQTQPSDGKMTFLVIAIIGLSVCILYMIIASIFDIRKKNVRRRERLRRRWRKDERRKDRLRRRRR